MTRSHVPVLAGELIELTAPGTGRHRDRLHLRCGRSRAPDRRPDRVDRHARLHRPRPARRGALRRARARGGLRDALPAHGLRRRARPALRGGRQGRRDLSRPRHLLDAGGRSRARLLLLVRRAARHAHGPEPGPRRARDREHLGRAPAGAAVPAARRGPQLGADRARDREAARSARRSRRPASSLPRSRPRCRLP